MLFRHNRLLVDKKLLGLVVMVLVALVLFGCTGTGAVPRGWSGIAVANDTLFVGSMQGKVIAVNASDGGGVRELVTLEVDRPSGGFSCVTGGTSAVAIYGTPVVAEGLVYVTGYDGKVYALNSTSGSIRWVYPRQGALDEPIVGGPVLAAGKVYFGSSGGKVYALDAATGDLKWEFTTGDKIWSTPAIADETLYIGSFDKKLYALDLDSGRKKWEFEAGGAIVATPLLYDDTIYVGSFDRYFYAVDATNGRLRWRFMGENWFWAKPVAYNGVIYAANLDGKVYALGAERGNKVAEFDLKFGEKKNPISSSPVLVNGSVIVATEDGKVYALDAETKRVELLADLGEEVYAPISAGDGVVYIHTQKKDTLYALSVETGVIQWSRSLSSK